MMEIIEGKDKYKVKLVAIKSGEDLTVIISGGEKPHIGAMAVSIPRPSLKDLNKVSTSTSVFTLIGHKEDELSKQIAENITKVTKKVTVAIVGLHIDKATAQDIGYLIQNTQKVVNKLRIKLVKKAGFKL
jgi:predicted transcriptional regulator